MASVANLAVFQRNWACFCGVAGFFRACGLLVLIEICLFFGLDFFQIFVLRLLFFKFYGTFAVSVSAKQPKGILGVFL